jgi:hypothetical protein
MAALTVGTTFGILSAAPAVAGVKDVKNFYLSVAQAVEAARGTALVSFIPGIWKVRVHPIGAPVQDVYIDIPMSEQATVTFNYLDGILQKGSSIEFEPEIRVIVGGKSIAIRSIAYDAFGHATIRYSGAGTPPPFNDSSAIEQTFTLSRQPSSLFLGKLLLNASIASKCNGSLQSCGAPTPTIAQVDFEKLDAHHPGLAVTMSDQSIIQFDPSNRIQFDGPASVLFSQLTYDTTHAVPINGVMENLKANIKNSQFTTNGLELDATSGLSFNIGKTTFGKQGDGSYSIGLTGTSGDIALGDATDVTLPGGMRFLGDSGSQFHMVNASVSFPASGAPAVTFDPGSRLSLVLRDGVFPIAPGSIGYVASGKVDVLLNGGKWTGLSGEPTADLSINGLDVALSHGTFRLNANSAISLQSGSSLSADHLNFAMAKPGLAGTLKTFLLKGNAAGTFGLPSGFLLSITSGTILSMDSSDPIVLQPGDFPSGSVALDGGFSSFYNHSGGSFALTDGTVHLKAHVRPDSGYSVNVDTLDGLLTIVSTDVTMYWDTHIHNFSGNRNVGGGLSGTGRLAATIRKGITIPVVTPAIYHTPDHDDMRLYPIRMKVSSNSDTNLPDTQISFDSQGFQLGSAGSPTLLPLSLIVSIAPGLGEHQQPDDQDGTADGTHGPGQDQHRQEIFTDTYPGCRVHLYLVAGDYPLTATLAVSSRVASGGEANALDIAVNNVLLGSDIGFDRDGCDLSGIVGIFGGVLGTFVGGPFGGAIGGGLGHYAGGRVDDHIDARIESGIRDKIEGYEKTWTIAVP